MKRDPAERAWGKLTKMQRLRVLVNLKGTDPIDLIFARFPWADIPESVRDRFRVMLSVHIEISRALNWIGRDAARISEEADAAYQRAAGRVA